MNRSLTYRVVQDNATSYGEKPILRSPEYNTGHRQGSHSTVPGIQSTECQSCTNEWIFDAPFKTEQEGQRQAPILVVACYTYQSTLSWETQPGGHESSTPLTGALLHEVGNRSWLIDLPEDYSFIYPPSIPWPGELSPPANPKILFIFGTIGSILAQLISFLMKPYEARTRINSHPRHRRNTSPSLTAEAPSLRYNSPPCPNWPQLSTLLGNVWDPHFIFAFQVFSWCPYIPNNNKPSTVDSCTWKLPLVSLRSYYIRDIRHWDMTSTFLS